MREKSKTNNIRRGKLRIISLFVLGSLSCVLITPANLARFEPLYWLFPATFFALATIDLVKYGTSSKLINTAVVMALPFVILTIVRLIYAFADSLMKFADH